MPETLLPPQDRIVRLVGRALFVLGVTVAAALAWAQFRGFDMLDGAYYFLLYQDPADNPDTTTRFHLLARPLWLLCGQNIIAFRFATIIAATFACWIFWRGWRQILKPTVYPGIYWWPLWLATMAGLTWVPLALTYNSLATIFALLVFGAIFGGFGPEAADRRRLWHLWPPALVLAGSFLGLYLAKPPAAVAVAAACFFLLCFDPRLKTGLRVCIRVAGIVLIVAVAGAALFFVTRPGFSVNRYFYVAGAPFTLAMLVKLALRYLAEVRIILPEIRGDFAWTIIPALLAGGAGLFAFADSKPHRRWLSCSLGLLLVATLGAFLARNLWDGSFGSVVSGNFSRYYFLLWGSLLIVWLSYQFRPRNAAVAANRLSAPWTMVLLALPLVSSFGSTNTVYVSALHETVFWSAGLLLLASIISTAYSTPWFAVGISALLSIGSLGAIFSGHFLRPYMFQPSLWKQTDIVAIGEPPTKLRVDPALASFLRQVRSTLDAHGYKPGDDVFGFFNLPGVVFAMGAREPGAPWYFGTWYHNDEADGAKIRMVPLQRRQNAWIVTQDDLRRFEPQFHYFNIDFPNGYTRIGNTINPVSGLEVGIWKPRGRP